VKLKKLIYVSMFATIMGVLGMMPPIFTGISPVPITLQSLGVMLAGSVLGARFGAKYAALSQILFLLLVVAGLPLLSGGRGGIGVLVGPSAGYLIGYVAGAFVIGWFAYRLKEGKFFKLLLINLFGGIFVVYLFGIPVQALMMNISLVEGMVTSLVFLPGDVTKVVVASIIAVKLLNTVPFRKEVHV
jgi:biotin transport system substrate-specific component